MAQAEPEPQPAPATLELSTLALRRAGSALLSGLSLRSSARQIGLVGDWSALFQALTGQAELATGSARIGGCGLWQALAEGVVGFAPCDPVLPSTLTVLEYLRHAARLSHGSAARAALETKHALSDFGLDRLVTTKLGQLAPHHRRALGIACAALGAPPVLCLESPLRDLDAEPADYVARLCRHAAQRYSVIVSAAWPRSPSAERALLDDCQELFVLERGALVGQGSPSQIFEPAERYSLRVLGGKTPDFLAAVRASGCRIEGAGRAGEYRVLLAERGNTDALLDAAVAHQVAVLELTPRSDAR